MKDLGANAFSYGYASPVLMAVTYNDDGTVNVMNLHEVTRTNAEDLACCIGKPKKTHENIEKRRAFTLTLANESLMKEIDYFGTVSGYNVPNKFEKTGLKAVNRISSAIYENGGFVAAVCHGPAALVNIKLSNGSCLVSGKKVTGFTDDEEREIKFEEYVPFLLETELRKRGGIFQAKANWTTNVVTDERLITGQNLGSAAEVGEAIVRLLS